MTLKTKSAPPNDSQDGEVTESAPKKPTRSVYLSAEAALERARGAIENAGPIDDGYLRGFGELSTAIEGLPAALTQNVRESWERVAVRLMRNPLGLRAQAWNHREPIRDVYRAVAAVIEEARKAEPEPAR